MSRFLKSRHYSIIIVGVNYKIRASKTAPIDDKRLREIANEFMMETGISYTEEDLDRIISEHAERFSR